MIPSKAAMLKLAVLWGAAAVCSFYVGVYVYMSVYFQIDAVSAGVFTALILVFGLISFLVSYPMLKKRDITRMQLAVILISAAIFSTSFTVLADMDVIRY